MLLILTIFNVLLYSIIGHTYIKPAHVIHYNIQPGMAPNFNCIKVSGYVKGKQPGRYLLRAPQLASNVLFHTPKSELKITKTNDPTVFELAFSSQDELNFHYDICFNNPVRNIDGPILERELVAFAGKDILLTPEENRKDQALVSVDLSGFSEQFKTITSFNYNQRKFNISTSIEDLRASLLSWGNYNVDNLQVNQKNVYLVTTGEWSFFKKPPQTYIKDLISTQRNFWNDNDFDHYVIFLVKQKYNVSPRIFRGEHRHNYFIGLMPEDKNAFNMCLYSLSHETFHAWLGMKMKIELPQGGIQWFIEGFNDFYGLNLAHKSNLINMEDYITIYNLQMKHYFLSPLKLATHKTLRENFTVRSHFAQMQQLKGHMLAKNLRDKYRNEAQNKFDTALRDLFNQYTKEHWSYLTEARIDSIFSKHLGNEEWNKFKHTLAAGEPIEFSQSAFQPYATLEDKELDCPEFGFNLEKFEYQAIIADIDPTSNAYLAGLRNGNQVKFHSLDYKVHDKEVILIVSEYGNDKIITFKPNIVKKKVPQYVMVKGDVLEKRLKNRV